MVVVKGTTYALTPFSRKKKKIQCMMEHSVFQSFKCESMSCVFCLLVVVVVVLVVVLVVGVVVVLVVEGPVVGG